MGLDIAGVVFDKDGTLYDFRASWGRWLHDLLDDLADGDAALADRLGAALGFDRAGLQFHPHSPVIAGTLQDILRAIRPHLGVESQAGLAGKVEAAAQSATMVEAVPLATYLSDLRANGLKLGVATNDSAAAARAHLGRSGVVEQFDFIAGYDSGHGAKPGPGMLHAFLSHTGLGPRQVVMVGDSVGDLATARAAGVLAVGVLTGPATTEELAPLADAVLPSIADLPDWLNATN